MDNRRIGFFDSGIGGLTSIPYLMKEYPDEHVIFFGDTARTPYGSKSSRVIRRFALEIGDFMVKSNVKMIVAACNTISANGLDVIREKYPDLPVTGVIEPACDVVAAGCGSDTSADKNVTVSSQASSAAEITEKLDGITELTINLACLNYYEDAARDTLVEAMSNAVGNARVTLIRNDVAFVWIGRTNGKADTVPEAA